MLYGLKDMIMRIKKINDICPKLKDSDGRPSVSFTMLAVTFFIMNVWLILYITQGFTGVEVPRFEMGEVMKYFSPILVLYFFRRWQVDNVL